MPEYICEDCGLEGDDAEEFVLGGDKTLCVDCAAEIQEQAADPTQAVPPTAQ